MNKQPCIAPALLASALLLANTANAQLSKPDNSATSSQVPQVNNRAPRVEDRVPQVRRADVARLTWVSLEPETGNAVPPLNGPSTSTDPGTAVLGETSGCTDVLSTALQQDAPGQPCWADIRTVDHWNTMTLASGPTIQGGPGFLPAENEAQSGFNFALGGVGGLLYQRGTDGHAYAGAAAFSGFLQRRRWELMYEDGGALGAYNLNSNQLAGLNRAALRANGRLTSRWLWQGSATNAYGTDLVRLFAPLDYRTVGTSEAPVTDTIAYGLHSGNLLDQQEDFKLRSAVSRRTNWDFAVAHTYRHYEDDGIGVNTIRARAQAIHATSPNTAIGITAGADRQTGLRACTLGGAGLLGLAKFGNRASLNVTATGNAASSECGDRAQFTGDASLSIRATDRTDLYLTGNRDLADGVIENLTFLSSASGGFRHQFSRSTSLRLSGAAIYGTDPKTATAYNGSFTEVAMSYPLGAGFLQETSYRHYQISKIPGGDNRNLVTFTLWWSPKKNQLTLLNKH